MTAIVLAGGNSSRFHTNKAFALVDGKPIINRVLSTLETIFSEIIVVTNSAPEYSHLNVKTVADIHPGSGPLSGIHAGLAASRTEFSFIVACDMPFLQPSIILRLQQFCRNYSAVVPRVGEYLEPLHAFYSKKCVDIAEKCIKDGRYSVLAMIEQVETCCVDFSMQKSFLNINTREDFSSLCEKSLSHGLFAENLNSSKNR